VEIYTIGFTRHSAEDFFESLKDAGITRLIDVRLNNTSQLAGFAKRDDLRYFLGKVCGVDYVHEPRLAPTADLLDVYKKRKGDWGSYERSFLALLAERRVEDLPDDLFAGRPVLLCSEHSPRHCHRRLVVEYLDEQWGDVKPVHL
jgi:uncharacterized protein (DUF488 family)